MKKKLLISFSIVPVIFSGFLFFPQQILAHCPLCVAGAGVGLSLSRYFGVDDSITGLWMAAMLGAISFWTYQYIVRRLKRGQIFLLKPFVYISVFGLTLWSFYKFNLVVTMEKLYGLDKLTFGIIVGGVAFYLMEEINNVAIYLRQKSLFPYQKLITGLGIILLLSYVQYVLIGYYI